MDEKEILIEKIVKTLRGYSKDDLKAIYNGDIIHEGKLWRKVIRQFPDVAQHIFNSKD